MSPDNDWDDGDVYASALCDTDSEVAHYFEARVTITIGHLCDICGEPETSLEHLGYEAES